MASPCRDGPTARRCRSFQRRPARTLGTLTALRAAIFNQGSAPQKRFRKDMQASWLRVVGVVSVAVAAGAFVGCEAQDFTDGSEDVASADVGSDENASFDE